MNVIWDSGTIKKIGNFVSDELENQNFKKIKFCNLANFHRNTLRSLLLGNPSITCETVIRGLLALDESFDALLLELYPKRSICLKKKNKKERYIKSLIHYLKKQSISKEEFEKLVNQYWEES